MQGTADSRGKHRVQIHYRRVDGNIGIDDEKHIRESKWAYQLVTFAMHEINSNVDHVCLHGEELRGAYQTRLRPENG